MNRNVNTVFYLVRKAKSEPIKKPVEIQTNNKKNSVVEPKNKDLKKSDRHDIIEILLSGVKHHNFNRLTSKQVDMFYFIPNRDLNL
jgi:hypothetical protein